MKLQRNVRRWRLRARHQGDRGSKDRIKGRHMIVNGERDGRRSSERWE